MKMVLRRSGVKAKFTLSPRGPLLEAKEIVS